MLKLSKNAMLVSLLFSPLILSLPAQAANQYLFVLAGQSNMYGGSGEKVSAQNWKNLYSWQPGGVSAADKKIENDFDAEIVTNKIEGRVKFWQVGISGQGKFETLKYSGAKKELMQMHSPGFWQQHGPTIGAYFGAEFLLRLKNDPTAEVYLVGNAASGTGFSGVNKYEMTWSASLPAKHRLYYNMIWHAKNAAKAVPNATVGGLLWLQGENDVGMTAKAYAAAVKAMVYGFRTQVPRALSSKFFLSTMLPKTGFSPSAGTYMNNADRAHRKIISSSSAESVYNTELVDTIGMQGIERFNAQWEKGKAWAPLHYSAFALRRIGRCFAALAQTVAQKCDKF